MRLVRLSSLLVVIALCTGWPSVNLGGNVIVPGGGGGGTGTYQIDFDNGSNLGCTDSDTGDDCQIGPGGGGDWTAGLFGSERMHWLEAHTDASLAGNVYADETNFTTSFTTQFTSGIYTLDFEFRIAGANASANTRFGIGFISEETISVDGTATWECGIGLNATGTLNTYRFRTCTDTGCDTADESGDFTGTDQDYRMRVVYNPGSGSCYAAVFTDAWGSASWSDTRTSGSFATPIGYVFGGTGCPRSGDDRCYVDTIKICDYDGTSTNGQCANP